MVIAFSSAVYAQKEASDVRSGNREYKKQNYVEAEVNYRRGLEKNKDGYEAHYNLGDALFKQDKYFQVIDPVAVNHQGEDFGIQYRTGIYYCDPADAPTVSAALAALAEKYDQPLAVENKPLENFYPAEEYHQKYLEKHPDGYCHIHF